MSETFRQSLIGSDKSVAVEISAKPADPTTETTATFSFVASGTDTLTCQVDSAAEVPCTSGVSFSALSPGEKRLVIRSGGVEIRSFSWTMLPPPVYLMSIGNSDPGYMHVFEQNTSTGDLSLKSKLALGGWSNWGAISHNKKWGYSVEMGTNTVSAVDLTNPSAIALINTTTLATQPRNLAAHPTMNRIYVSDNLVSGSVYTLSLDPTTGATTQLGSSIAAGAKPRAIRVSPNGRVLYVANWWSWDVSIYTIDQTTGELTSAGTQSTCGDPVGLDMSSDGGFLFVACSSSANIGVYSTNTTTGALSAVAGSPFGGATDPVHVKVSPSGNHLVATGWSGTVTIYTLNPTSGALSAPADILLGTNGNSSQFDPAGKFLYITTYSSPGQIKAYNWSASGLGAAATISTLPTDFEAGMNLVFW